MRLSETAVTPSDWSMQKPIVSAYDGSLPTSVMSVPCSVVTTRGTREWPVPTSTCLAR